MASIDAGFRFWLSCRCCLCVLWRVKGAPQATMTQNPIGSASRACRAACRQCAKDPKNEIARRTSHNRVPHNPVLVPPSSFRSWMSNTSGRVTVSVNMSRVNPSHLTLLITHRPPQYPSKCILPVKSAKITRRLGEGVGRMNAEEASSRFVDQQAREACIHDVIAMDDLDTAAIAY